VLTAALCVGLAAVPGRGRSQTAALESFDGTWALTGGQRGMDEAIDRVVDQLNIFIREIARGEIHRRLDPEQRVRLVVEDEETVRLGLDDWGPVRVRLDGRTREVRGPDGDRVRISMRFHRGRLIERHVAGQGTRQNVFSLGADGSRLTMAVRIGADQLPSDIRYRLTYRRVR
jgi:hypothetical protein